MERRLCDRYERVVMGSSDEHIYFIVYINVLNPVHEICSPSFYLGISCSFIVLSLSNININITTNPINIISFQHDKVTKFQHLKPSFPPSKKRKKKDMYDTYSCTAVKM